MQKKTNCNKIMKTPTQNFLNDLNQFIKNHPFCQLPGQEAHISEDSANDQTTINIDTIDEDYERIHIKITCIA